MAARFKRTSRGVEARFDAAETQVLRDLLGQLEALLADRDAPPAAPGAASDPLEALTGLSATPGPSTTPEDPVLARLLPDGYTAGHDDPQATADFRRYTEPELLAGKVAGARAVAASLPQPGRRLVVDAELAATWLSTLNDLRLALGTRLGVTEDNTDELEQLVREHSEDPRAWTYAVYGWLGWLQETLVEGLSASL